MTEKRATALATLCAVAGNMIFGFTFLLSKKCMAVASPFIMLSFRFFIAVVIMSLMMLTGKFRLTFRLRTMWPVVALAVCEPVLYFFCESYGIQLISTSLAGTLIALIPIATMLIGFVFLHERPTVFQIICAVVSAGGVALTTIGQSDSGTFNPWGVVLLLCGVLLCGVFITLNRSISGKFSVFERTFMQFAVGFIVFTGFALVENRGNIAAAYIVPAMTPDFIIPVALLALFGSVGAFLMINFSVGNLDVTRVAIAANMTTVVSIIAGVIFLHELFGLWQIIGSVVILVSVYFVECPPKRLRRAKAANADE